MATPAVHQHASTFPVDWQRPDLQGSFTLDVMHFPDPLSPMTGSLSETAFVYGHRKASREYNLGIRFETAIINHFRFDGMLPEQHSEDEARALGKKAEQVMGREMGRQLDRWRDDHLPMLEKMLARLGAMDPRGLGADQQLAMLDELHHIQSDLWTIHFRIVAPMAVSMQVFAEFFSETVGGTDQDAQALLVGTTSQSIAAGIGLSDLANTARMLRLEELFNTTSVEQLVPALGATEEGRVFLEQLHQYLERYGLRSDLFELATPTWREDPSIALATILTYLETGYDARAAHMQIAGEADAAVAMARDKLAAYPEAMRAQFEALLQSARHGTFLQEEHNF